MNQVLEGLIGTNCFVYIDDIIVYGRNLQVHNRNLALVLQRLAEHRLKVKKSKCQFLKSEITYLGFVISSDEIKMDPNKTKAIRNFKIPTNEKEVRSFIGLAGFYRKFIDKFSDIAEPLHKLLRKDVIFKWDDKCQAAFDELISIISNDIVLQYPDFNQMFYLTCDASDNGLGCVLSQKDANQLDRPISFISRSLNNTERNYSTTEKECLAIVWGVQTYRNYLFGRKFIILSDHRPLVWLHNVKDPGARLLRWRLKLNDYDYEIQYTPGKTNYVADELSRNGYSDPQVNSSHPSVSEKIIPAVRQVVTNNDVDNNEDANEIESEPEEELETTDFIPRHNRTKVIDPVQVENIIREQHRGPIGGHRGINATTSVINIYYDIPNLKKKVTEIIRKCEICQRTKYSRVNRNLPLQFTVSSSEPNEKNCI